MENDDSTIKAEADRVREAYDHGDMARLCDIWVEIGKKADFEVIRMVYQYRFDDGLRVSDMLVHVFEFRNFVDDIRRAYDYDMAKKDVKTVWAEVSQHENVDMSIWVHQHRYDDGLHVFDILADNLDPGQEEK